LTFRGFAARDARSAVSAGRNRPASPKIPAQSLASRNLFPAEFSAAHRDWSECRQRPVRVCTAPRQGYVAGGAGAAVGPGGGVIVLANQNGAVLTLSGTQAGLIVAADLNGLVITMR
jgi:hypothetical protein